MHKLLKRLVREEQGQDVIEYALLAAAIGVALIPTVPALGTALITLYGEFTTAVGTL